MNEESQREQQEEVQTTPPTEPTRTEKALRGKPAQWTLAVVSFTESSFLPILIDPFLVAMTLARTKSWVRYSLIASGASVIGGIFGYILGALFFDLVGERIVSIYGLEEQFARTAELLDGNAFLVTLVGAFTPIPYKLIALVGGLLKINFWVFVIASIIGRSARFFLVAYITKQFGDYALSVFTRRFNIATAAVIIGIVCYAALVVVK